jgi:hypothetical protein
MNAENWGDVAEAKECQRVQQTTEKEMRSRFSFLALQKPTLPTI